jgi:hypothetical protein
VTRHAPARRPDPDPADPDPAALDPADRDPAALGPAAPGADADEQLARAGARLADGVVEAVPRWAQASVARVLDEWEAAGGRPDPHWGGRQALLARAESDGRQAARALGGELRRLLSADVDAQWTTPLALVRPLVAVPTAVLADAGAPVLGRDRFVEERFPGDPYGLTPSSLAALDDELAGPASAWGVAKAVAHRARHAGRSAGH